MNNIITITCGYCQKESIKYEPPCQKGRTKYCSKNCQRFGKSDDQKFWQYATEEEKLSRLKVSYEKKVIKQEGCWDWVGALKTGYGCVRFASKTLRIHRLSWLIHKGEIPNNQWVLHKCDNRKCSNPDHLFLGSRQDNVMDMVSKGRNIFWPGESNGRAIITKMIADKIKNRLNSNESPTIIAKEFNIPRNIVYRIKYNKKAWA